MKLEQVKFKGIDRFNRPVFESMEQQHHFYGDVSKLFNFEATKEEVLKRISAEDLCYFGSKFDCEPMGTPSRNLKITDIDTQQLKENWTPDHVALFETIDPLVRDFAGDLFEIKWYSGANKEKMEWEIRNNLIGSDTAFQVSKCDEFMRIYDKLTIDQKNLIYYAYEA